MVLGVAVFAVALLGTWCARRYALHRRLIDAPGARRSHAVATPRGGGIAIVVALLPVFAWMAWQNPESRMLPAFALAGLILVAGIGWIDDHRPLSAWLRLVVHVVAAALLATGMALSGAALWWCLCVCVLAVGLVNVWNFMDGIDGLATTQAMLVVVGALAVGDGGVLALALGLACAGFLPFNAPRATIFLGDVGSGSLGYLVACLFAWLPASEPPILLLLALPLSAFLVDAALTLLSRMLRGERWWQPHVQHLYQRLVQRGASHVQVTACYGAWTLAALLMLFMLEGRTLPVIIGVLAAWYLLTAAAWSILRASLDTGVPSSRMKHDD
ncbi:glycosyltransferase family 4 protein [Luteimonas sp. WGS1318]|uniref:MraY family glycosyltransferase n=1 Tax=Luteimonas sp. WGS1318 TaxID=3366815 RepID=UPI00372D2E41